MRSIQAAVVFGTRPEVIKLAPILRLLGRGAQSVHTGQHFDPALSSAFLDELGLPPPAVQLSVGGTSRGHQIGEATQLLDDYFALDAPDVVIVQGDTNTTLAGALAANARTLPVVHVEAGLRSFDRTMPEEHNRVLVDHLADLCCAPTERQRANLTAEGIPDRRVVVTGNTIVDAVQTHLPSASARRHVLEERGLVAGEFVVATFHRPENVDHPTQLHRILDELGELPLPVVLPLHPRTAAVVGQLEGARTLGALQICEPLGYHDFLAVAAECAFVISDSGGIQEEASILKRPVLVVRSSTERPELLGSFATLVAPGAAIGEHARAWAADVAGLHARLESLPCPYGNGDAASRTIGAIETLLLQH